MNDSHFHGPPLGESDLEKLRHELEAINSEEVEIDGMKLLSGKCYHFSPDPLHVLFNTNCPDSLKEKIEAILHKYVPDENSTPETKS